jgi:hypothetical protein
VVEHAPGLDCRLSGPGVSSLHPCKIRHVPLNCHCDSGVNRQFRRGITGKGLLTGPSASVGANRPPEPQLRFRCASGTLRQSSPPHRHTRSCPPRPHSDPPPRRLPQAFPMTCTRPTL